MNELQLINTDVTMTSLDVAELTGKQHAHVIRDIRNEIEQLEKAGIIAGFIFELGSYKDKQNQERPIDLNKSLNCSYITYKQH
jgi:phage regulator Rha-like protein